MARKLKMAGFGLGAFALMILAWWAGSAGFALSRAVTTVAAATAPPPERIEVTRQAMVRALEGKLQMTTTSMRLEKYVPGGRCRGNWWQRFAYTDCVTMLVSAKVNAGFDWRAGRSVQITAAHDAILVNLGSPQIFDVVLDPAKTEVLQQDRGFLVANDPNLELRVLKATDAAFRSDACENGILTWAALSAKERIGDALRDFLERSGDSRPVRIAYTIPQCSR